MSFTYMVKTDKINKNHSFQEEYFMDDLIIVDCQHDFIDGSLACGHSHEAVSWLIEFINTHEVRCLYTSDWHSKTNGSFKVNGGIWPVHCVAGTKGASLDESFAEEIKEPSNRPSAKNLFLKGKDDKVEQYSAFNGTSEKGEVLGNIASPHVYVGGIASEYCVKETVLALLSAGRKVTLLASGLGYVSEADHMKALKELEEKGVEILK